MRAREPRERAEAAQRVAGSEPGPEPEVDGRGAGTHGNREAVGWLREQWRTDETEHDSGKGVHWRNEATSWVFELRFSWR